MYTEEDLQSYRTFEVYKTLCARGYIKEYVSKYCSTTFQLLLLRLGMLRATKLKTLQKLQNRAARIVTGSPFDTPAAPLLQRLGWPSIDKPINRETCTMVFKSLNDLALENLGNIFSKLSDVHARVLRNTKCNLALPTMRTAYGQKSFAFRGANAWNKLD